MSFVKKAVKKVFKAIKKVVKSDLFKWVAIAALTFFTAGVAAGGFAAFTGVSTLPQFFVAVGQTMATGAASITASLGFKGASASLAQHGGAAAIQAGLTTSATSATGQALAADLITGTVSGSATVGAETLPLTLSAKGSALASAEAAHALSITPAFISEAGTAGSQLANVVAGLTTGPGAEVAASSGGSKLMWNAIAGGAAAMVSKSSRDKKRPTFVAGGLSHGGPAHAGPQPYFVVGGKRPESEQTQVSAQSGAGDTNTLAGRLARKERGGVQALVTGNGGVLDVGGPAKLAPSQVTGAPAGVPVNDNAALAANAAPESRGVDSTQEFFKDFRSTSILSPRNNRSFEERIFGGLAGV
jgi:hypothetical protein